MKRSMRTWLTTNGNKQTTIHMIEEMKHRETEVCATQYREERQRKEVQPNNHTTNENKCAQNSTTSICTKQEQHTTKQWNQYNNTQHQHNWKQSTQAANNSNRWKQQSRVQEPQWSGRRWPTVGREEAGAKRWGQARRQKKHKTAAVKTATDDWNKQ